MTTPHTMGIALLLASVLATTDTPSSSPIRLLLAEDGFLVPYSKNPTDTRFIGIDLVEDPNTSDSDQVKYVVGAFPMVYDPQRGKIELDPTFEKRGDTAVLYAKKNYVDVVGLSGDQKSEDEDRMLFSLVLKSTNPSTHVIEQIDPEGDAQCPSFPSWELGQCGKKEALVRLVTVEEAVKVMEEQPKAIQTDADSGDKEILYTALAAKEVVEETGKKIEENERVEEIAKKVAHRIQGTPPPEDAPFRSTAHSDGEGSEQASGGDSSVRIIDPGGPELTFHQKTPSPRHDHQNPNPKHDHRHDRLEGLSKEQLINIIEQSANSGPGMLDNVSNLNEGGFLGPENSKELAGFTGPYGNTLFKTVEEGKKLRARAA